MEKRQILWAIVFGSMLAITGCGDDESSNGGSAGSGGSAGADGSAGSGGSAAPPGGPSNSTCEAICSSSCDLQGVDPEVGDCLTQCEMFAPQFDDNCGSQADAFLGCIESVECNPDAGECQSEAIAWGTCLAGVL